MPDNWRDVPPPALPDAQPDAPAYAAACALSEELSDGLPEAAGTRPFWLESTAPPISSEPQREPLLGASPIMIGFDEPVSAPSAIVAPQPPPIAPRSASLSGITASIAIHLLPLLLLVVWSGPPARLPEPIPVRLVLQEPASPEPPKPPPKPHPETPPPRIASIDIGDPSVKPAPPASPPAAEEPSPATPPNPAPPSAPSQARPELVSALPKPAAAVAAELKMSEPPAAAKPSQAEPETPPAQPPLPAMPHSAAAPRPLKNAAIARPSRQPVAQAGDVAGPAATRDEYLFRCEAMIRRHYFMLPASVLAGRSGIALISILILADGTIARVGIARSSGYSDIDERAEQMIAAVRRFPPLPQWFQGESMPVHFQLAFRDGVPL